MFGKAYVVGAGPGDPGLLTVRAAHLLAQADVLLYDALVSESIIALAPDRCAKIFVGKRRGSHAMHQRTIVALMIRHALAGQCVVRLKGGDPFVFGRGGEEALALSGAGISFEIVPGISSAVAVPAYAGIPVTHRGVSASFTVITGHEDPEKAHTQIDWSRLARRDGTLVVLMGLSTLRTTAHSLRTHGMPAETPACVIENGTLPEQRVVQGTLQTIADAVERNGFQGPATIVIGDVVRLRNQIAQRSERSSAVEA